MTDLITITKIIGILGGAYVVGALPVGYCFARWWCGVDLTGAGSGNIGATNAARVLGGVRYFVLIFFLDATKAFGAVRLAHWYAPCVCIDEAVLLFLVAVCVLVGNGYSIFIGFKGGKGVATTVGLLAALAPWQITVIFVCGWLASVAVFRWAALSSLLAILLASFSYWLLPVPCVPGLTQLFLFLIVWLCLRHRDNLKATR